MKEVLEPSAEILSPEQEESRSEESGYVMPMTALLLIPLLIFSAFAIDVGAWYLKGQKIQRASDAAALAGVIFMPDLDKAEAQALDVAAKNGMIDQDWIDAGNPGVANANIEVTAKGRQLRVRIDSETPAFLGQIVTDDVTVERYSVADISDDVGFGSPTSGLGTGNLGEDVLGSPDGGGSYAQGIWLSISGYCSAHVQGDPFSTAWYTGPSSWDGCSAGGRQPNPTFRAEQDMYDYVVDIPAGAGRTSIEVYEPGICTEGIDLGGVPPLLQFRLYASDDTPEYDLDNLSRPPVSDQVFPADACSGGRNGWYSLGIVEPDQSGRWYVRANSRASEELGENSINNFALRAVSPSGDGTLCARSAATPSCPTIYAREWASFYRPRWGNAGEPTEFHMSQIEEEHAGKTMQIRIFDPGEGMDNIQFLDDAGEAVDFTWRHTNCSVGGLCDNPRQPEDPTPQDAADCGGNKCLDVTRDKFNGQWLTIEHELPADYQCSSSCWWKVRYTPHGGDVPTDRTTWSVRMLGTPARLTE